MRLRVDEEMMTVDGLRGADSHGSCYVMSCEIGTGGEMS